MNEMLRLADNPIFVKHLRSRLRKSAVVSSLVVVVFLCIIICIIDYLSRQPFGAGKTHAGMWCMVLLNGILLNFIGGSQVATSISYVKDSGILDYHRITPLPSRVQTLGFLLGAPIREYILFVATLPFSLYLCIVEEIGVGGFSMIVLVQVGFAVFSHALGLLVGLSAKSSKGASGRFVISLFGLWFMANSISGMGSINNDRYYGPALMSPIPVIFEVLEPEGAAQQRAARAQFRQGNKGGAFGGGPAQPPGPLPPPPEAKFFGIEIPLVLQTLAVQGAMIFFIFLGCSRRIRSSRIPIYSKPQAIAFFGTLTLLALATLWGLKQEIILIANVYVMLLFGSILLGMSTQASGEIQKGYIRAAKEGKSAPSPWSDLSSNHFTVLCFMGIMAVFAAVDYWVMSNGAPQAANAFMPVAIPIEAFIPVFGIAIGTLVLIGFMVQYFYLTSKRAGARIGLYLFFAWVGTLLIGILFSARGVEEGAFFMALTPLTSIFMSAIIQVQQGNPRIDPHTFRMVAYVFTALQVILFVYLSYTAEKRIRNKVAAERRDDEFQDKRVAAVEEEDD